MSLAPDTIDVWLRNDLATYDPYDLWGTRPGVWLRSVFYRLGGIATPLVAPVSILDAYAPKMARAFIRPREYPMVRALAALTALNRFQATSRREYIDFARQSVTWLIENQCAGYHGACWGLGIPWMTKTGYRSASTPFITNTPYCVEALLRFSDLTNDERALAVALTSSEFLENDLKALIDEPGELALSYGPTYESRVVINANSYAMMMYAMLAERGVERFAEKATRIFNYLRSRQNSDGSWSYYGDDASGNFIDCLHSCFIVKNLVKFARYAETDVTVVVDRAIEYLLETLLDSNTGLARRFSAAAYPSLVKFDLYDQAELLNVLCMTGRRDEGETLLESTLHHFYIEDERRFGSQIDVFGRLNRMTYLRWGVMPMVYVLSEHT